MDYIFPKSNIYTNTYRYTHVPHYSGYHSTCEQFGGGGKILMIINTPMHFHMHF